MKIISARDFSALLTDPIFMLNVCMGQQRYAIISGQKSCMRCSLHPPGETADTPVHFAGIRAGTKSSACLYLRIP